MVGEPPESQLLEILQGAGKDGGECDGGSQGYGNRGGGCADPGRNGDVELHEGGYWDVGLCIGCCCCCCCCCLIYLKSVKYTIAQIYLQFNI